MKTEYIVMLAVVVSFIWQLPICFSGKPIKKKRLPGLVLLTAIAALALFAVAGTWLYQLGWPIYSAPYAAGIFAIGLIIPLTGVALAWAVWAIVRFAQKGRK